MVDYNYPPTVIEYCREFLPELIVTEADWGYDIRAPDGQSDIYA